MIYTVTLSPALDYFMTYDRLEPGAVNRTRTTRLAPGGKGIMESRMLSTMGVENTALGFIGGFSGKFIRDELTRAGIKTAFTMTLTETRINVKVKTDSSETSLDAVSPNLTEDDIENFIQNFNHLKPGDIVVFAGTAPESLGEDFYARLISIVRQKGAEFAIDIDGQKLLETLRQNPIVIKPNKEELEAVFSVKFASKEDIVPYGKKMQEMGAQNVMVSMAGEGALLFTAEDSVYFAPPVKGIIKNSVGAGDATVAGFIAEWDKSKNPLAAFKQGVACGTAKVFSEDMPSTNFLQECYQQIKIETL
ncbi:1-phosphofructokinase [Lactovum odontotermitis]